MVTEPAFATLPLLTPWEAEHIAQAIERRRCDTIQLCTFCSEQALFAYVTNDPLLNPPRWVDVCYPHSQWLRRSP
jgi:hypothetical protein